MVAPERKGCACGLSCEEPEDAEDAGDGGHGLGPDAGGWGGQRVSADEGGGRAGRAPDARRDETAILDAMDGGGEVLAAACHGELLFTGASAP